MKNGSGELPTTALTHEDEIAEYLMMGMRLYEGLDLRRYEMLAGAAMDEDKIAHLQSIGMIALDGPYMRATNEGRAVLNAVLRELLTD